MSLLDHLEELRERLIRAVGALAIGCVAGYFLAPWPLDWLSRPVEHAYRQAQLARAAKTLRVDVGADGTLRVPPGAIAAPAEGAEPAVPDRLEFFAEGSDAPAAVWLRSPSGGLFYSRPMDPFMVRLKAAVVIGVILAMPVVLWQAWGFIAPGLLAHEKRLAGPMIVSGTVLFPLGAAFAYWLLDFTLFFLAQFAMDDALVFNDAQAYLSFALTMMAAFGAVFELPLGVVVATRLGVVTVKWLAERRRAVFVVLLLVSAILTPTSDPITMLVLAAPLYILFEASLVVSRALDARRPALESAAAEAGAR